jgi:hypothetical protein
MWLVSICSCLFSTLKMHRHASERSFEQLKRVAAYGRVASPALCSARRQCVALMRNGARDPLASPAPGFAIQLFFLLRSTDTRHSRSYISVCTGLRHGCQEAESCRNCLY